MHKQRNLPLYLFEHRFKPLRKRLHRLVNVLLLLPVRDAPFHLCKPHFRDVAPFPMLPRGLKIVVWAVQKARLTSAALLPATHSTFPQRTREGVQASALVRKRRNSLCYVAALSQQLLYVVEPSVNIFHLLFLGLPQYLHNHILNKFL